VLKIDFMCCVVKSRASSVIQVLRFEYKDTPRVSPTFSFKEITEFLYDQGHESIISSFLPQKKARNVLNIDRRLIHLSGVTAFFLAPAHWLKPTTILYFPGCKFIVDNVRSWQLLIFVNHIADICIRSNESK
jgi:hypothetical protein